MAVLKCKMCGGNLEVTEGQSYGTCDSCGSTMTLPKVNDERILNLFNRANNYRLQNEFDKALATYESILEEDSNNAEAHWGCVLSKYGIEYVEDPTTHKRIPTCNRVQRESILADIDYKAALNNADSYSANLYQEEAKQISEIQKGILAVASNEKPYDIFICYKETDESGNRTIDSTLAQDIYFGLVNEGYNVFFSRITLENKLGQEYEPYIFAALNSAKVMLVIGTKAKYINAVWVKNEWARFLAMSKADKNKIIIPCYRDMDAYDLPDELSLFQAQDMSKIGFMQDLIRGIKKVLEIVPETPKVLNNIQTATVDTEALLKRAFILLGDAEWNKANALLEDVLNNNPENARAYLGKLMIVAKVNKAENLAKRPIKLSDYPDYQKAIKYADISLKNELESYNRSATDKYNEKELKAKQEQERIMAEEKIKKAKQEKEKFIMDYKESLEKEKRDLKFSAVSFVALVIGVLMFIMIIESDNAGMGSALISSFTFVGGLVVFLVSLPSYIGVRKKNKETKIILDKNNIHI